VASKRIGRGIDPESGGEWEITAWRTTTHGDWKYVKGHEPENQKGSRLTQNAIVQSESLKVAFTYPNGRTVYRTFRGGPPDDLDKIIDYWKYIGSL
jgi:hypothetical protein